MTTMEGNRIAKKNTNATIAAQTTHAVRPVRLTISRRCDVLFLVVSFLSEP